MLLPWPGSPAVKLCPRGPPLGTALCLCPSQPVTTQQSLEPHVSHLHDNDFCAPEMTAGPKSTAVSGDHTWSACKDLRVLEPGLRGGTA